MHNEATLRKRDGEGGVQPPIVMKLNLPNRNSTANKKGGKPRKGHDAAMVDLGKGEKLCQDARHRLGTCHSQGCSKTVIHVLLSYLSSSKKPASWDHKLQTRKLVLGVLCGLIEMHLAFLGGLSSATNSWGACKLSGVYDFTAGQSEVHQR